MKHVIAAAAATLLTLSSVALAQTTDLSKTNPASPSAATDAPDSMGRYYTEVEKTDFLASRLINATVYATTKDFDSKMALDKVSADWENIGEVNNIILSRDGSVRAVVLGVGGFLSIGEKNVAVKMSDLRFVKKVGDNEDDFYIVVNADKASLEKAPAYPG